MPGPETDKTAPLSGGEPGKLPVPASRQDLELWVRTPLKAARTWIAPDVIRLEKDGRQLVLKDVSRRPFLFRLLWCRRALHRETEAMKRLRDLNAAPQLLAVVDADAFLMEYLEASPLPARRLADELGTGFFEELTTAVEEMHRRGVAHGDLRRRNILVTPDRKPRLIDFETAVVDGPGPLRSRLFQFVSQVDDLTVLKIFGRYHPEALDEEEKTALAGAPVLLRIGRFLRKRVYHPLSPKKMKPRLQRLGRLLRGR